MGLTLKSKHLNIKKENFKREIAIILMTYNLAVIINT